MAVLNLGSKGVSNFKIGQRVNLLPPANESESGYAADFNIVHEDFLLYEHCIITGSAGLGC